MCEAIEDFDDVEKLGQGFSSANPLEEIDLGDEITPRSIFVNKNMYLEHKDAIIKSLRIMSIVLPGIILRCLDLAES
jgi:hypothetical protein